MNTSSNKTFFTINENRVKPVDPKTASVTISLEEFEDLMSYKRICQDLFAEFKEELL